MKTQAEKALDFRALHERDGAFIIPKPWDIGTARLLAHIGFEALATTSAGYAFSIGQRDLTIGRDQMIAHVADIVAATDLPKPTQVTSVTVGGQAASIKFIGIPWNLVGVLLINYQVPSGLVAGVQPVIVTIGNVSSPAANLTITK